MVVDKVTWQQVGRVTEPGHYMFRFGRLTITAEDLAIWAQFPKAAFTLVKTAAARDVADEFPEEFHLGVFELPESASAHWT